MGSRVPAPKPHDLRVLEGRTGSRYHEKAGYQKQRPIRPNRPAGLSPQAKKVWDLVVPELDRMALLTILDGQALAAYCFCFAEFERTARRLQEEGNVAPSLCKGGLRLAKVFAAEFGLTPASRGRLTVGALTTPEEDTEMPALLT